MTSPILTFLGATGTVTGSRFLVETDATQALVDAGLYQGLKELRQRNWDPFPRDPARIGSVALTHAHLDHCGYLPLLVKHGFHGPVRCTPETGALAALVLRDSAHLLEEEAEYANRTGYGRHRPALPLYDAADVEKALDLIEPVELGVSVAADERVELTFRSAGHILGSSTILVEAAGARVLFSGDLGRGDHPLVAPRQDPPAAETIVVESTYGDRRHADPDGPGGRGSILGDAIRRTVSRGGSVLIPAFAIDRTELVLLEIGRLMQAHQIPTVPVFVDSPMALGALRAYEPAREAAGVPRDYGIPQLHTVSSPGDSQALNRPARPSIVVSASGMASGGRVVHHLAEQLPDRRNTVVLTGFQAEGTRGRALLEGARQVKIHGRYVPVRAEIVLDDAFSAHADAEEVIGWLRRAPEPPRTVYVVHGEADAAATLARRIQEELGWTAVVPRFSERVRLD